MYEKMHLWPGDDTISNDHKAQSFCGLRIERDAMIGKPWKLGGYNPAALCKKCLWSARKAIMRGSK